MCSFSNSSKIKVYIDSQPYISLVDTGADVSCISGTLARTLLEKGVAKMQSSTVTVIRGVGGQPVPILGKMDLVLRLANLKVPQSFIVIEQLTCPLILGVDFLTSHQASLNFATQELQLYNGLTSLPLLKDLDQEATPLHVLTTTRIPPHSEVLLQVKIQGNSKEMGVVEPLQSLLMHKNVIAARTLVRPRGGQVTCMIRNIFPFAVTLRPRDTVAYFHPIETVLGELSDTTATVAMATTQRSATQLAQAKASIEKLGITLQNSDLTPDQKEQMTLFLAQNRDVFAADMSELGETHLISHHIDTGEAVPIKQRPYRTAPACNAEIERQVNDMLLHGVIEPSTSPWSSPVVLVKKKDGSYRFAVDYRKLNKVTKPIHFPLPRLDDALDIMGKSTIFSTLDLFSGFWQIPLDEESQEKSTFTTHFGSFSWKRMPFGLQGAPGSFQSLMNRVLAGLTFKMCLVFIDDIICLSQNFEDHLSHLTMIFDRIRKAGLRLKPSKCHFAAARVNYLGHVVSKDGVSVDPAKIDLVKNFPTPKSQHDVRSFLGLANYYRRFVKNFSQIAAPLNDLLKKDTKMNWNASAEEAFQTLKQALTSAPVLAFPDFAKQFILYTDASNRAIGYVLGQRDDEGRERVIAYGGRALHQAETRYGITEKETLALVDGIRHFKVYLTHNKFLVYTDHSATKFLHNIKDPTGRLGRWALFLQAYDYEIIHRPGRIHNNADALSRMPHQPLTVQSEEEDYEPPTPDLPPTLRSTTQQTGELPTPNSNEEAGPRVAKTTCQSFTSDEEPIVICMVDKVENDDLREMQCKDPQCAPFLAYLEQDQLPEDDKLARRLMLESQDYVVNNGLLYHLYYPRGQGHRTERLVRQLVVPFPLRNDILLSFHDSLLGSHFATERTYQAIRLRYFWIGMYSDIAEYVKTCIACQKAKRVIHPQRPELTPLPIAPNGLFSRWHTDILGPFTPSKEGYRYVLLFVCSYSKWVEIIPLKEASAATIAHHLYETIICRYGAPDQLLSDRGQNFMSKVVTEVCKIFQITRLHTSSYHPQTNACAERTNATIGQSIRALCDKNPLNWPSLLPGIAAALRTVPSTESTLFSPFFILFKQECRLPIDTALQPSELPLAARDAMENILSNAELTQEMVKQNVQRAQQRYKQQYDSKVKQPHYFVGQRVLLYCSHKIPGLSGKLQQKYEGPYYITKVLPNNVYIVRRCSDNKQLSSPVNALRLRPFWSPEDRLTNPPHFPLAPITESPEEKAEPAENGATTLADSASDNIKPQAPAEAAETHASDTTDTVPFSDDDLYQVEKILACKRIKQQKHYKIKWLGYKETTWEPEENIPDELIRDFHVSRTNCGKKRK